MELAARATEVAMRVADDVREDDGRRAVACREGCAHCCYQRVVAYAPEILRIARAIAALPDDERRVVEERVLRADDASRAMSRGERIATRAPCPLLEGDMCKVHAVRPLACRGQNSYDARHCERRRAGERGVPDALDQAWHLAHAHVGAALGAALGREGLDGHPLELVAALRVAIDRTNAGERWAAGMPVFLKARAIESGGER